MKEKNILNIAILIFCFSCIAGGAYNTYVHYDFSHSVDTKSYLKMAVGNFDVTVTHRYRVIVPFIAGSLAKFLDIIYPIIWKTRSGFDWSLRLSFFVVNSTLLSLAAFFIFKMAQWHKASLLGCIMAVLAFLTSRWAYYIAGIPYVDSLYLLVIVVFVYGLLTKNQWLIGFGLLIGPTAKESFLLFIPILLYFNRLNLFLTLATCLMGLAVFYGIRMYIFNTHHFTSNLSSFQNAIDHLEMVSYTFFRIFSLKGIAEVLFTFGLFNFFFVYLFVTKNRIKYTLSPVLYAILPPILVHIFLSGDVGRMLFISAPFFCTAIALGSDLAVEKLNLPPSIKTF